MRRSSKDIAEPRRWAGLFAALGDKTRLQIVSRLHDEGPLCIARLANGSRISRQAITKHLRIMEAARLVHHKRRGRESIWQLDRRRIEDARRYLGLISQQWDDALARLRDFVEHKPVD